MTHDVRPRPASTTRVDGAADPASDHGSDLAGASRAPGGEPTLRDLFARVNAFFYDKRTGLGLILAMAFLTLMGTLLEQAPDGVIGDQRAWDGWVASVRPRYGGWTSILAATGALTVFTSIWFRAVVVLLALSIIACTCHRVPQLWQRAKHPHLQAGPGLFEHAGLHDRIALDAPPEAALERVRAALTARHYRIVAADPGGADPGAPAHALYADRFRWAPFGTAVAHASFVIILIGVLVSTSFGFKDADLAVPVGGTAVPIGHGTGLTVEARGFADKYTDAGRPLDYASDLVLLKDGRQVAAQTVRVNSPLRYDGVSIHQASYGIATQLLVKDPGGAPVFAGAIPLTFSNDTKTRSFGKTRLDGADLTVYVGSAASGARDPQVGPGQALIEVYRGSAERPLASRVVDQGKTVRIGDLDYTFERERQYTGLMVVRDPGATFVWVGSVLMVLGLIATMFLRHRRIWARIESRDDGGADVRLASPERQDTAYERTFRQLSAAISGRAAIDHDPTRED
ncbi:MAG: cytochrome c biogenesis protein ResB [Austwickia sp.]|jgi:cytochrome c biogenesis protein|nr:MAG: cytochrome c biogenesis protein ResB [Austwickia sp.]